ncbi:IclR family transcriptional regulator (plasmid) [Cupriavidus taiwanensis]|uniref:IclR family transcriptional regulator n=1 Tax=Cupriavidus taiwanensis TaxID=164546 RepID=A0A9Q7XVY5_9BURK|nr:IclR family transcriptional regulator [Cupriavidus taiwanensis]SPD67498.1 IclR family transcriptional regulator [Cupriavidus taiwanensis]
MPKPASPKRASDANTPDDPGGVSDAAKATGTAAFSKFMAVLQLVADAAEPQTVAQLSRASGYPRPTVYRIVGALLAEGLVVEHPRTGTLTLGPRLISLASRSWGRSDLRIAAADALKTLRDTTRETVHLAVPSELGMVYIEKLESPQAVRMASRIGTRVTLYSSSVGKAYLSALPEAQREALLAQVKMERFTPNTVTDRNELRRELVETAERGYAEDREENEPQIFCYGAPILGPDGTPVAAISVSIPLFRRSNSPLESYVKPLREACQAVSAAIGPVPGELL